MFFRFCFCYAKITKNVTRAKKSKLILKFTGFYEFGIGLFLFDFCYVLLEFEILQFEILQCEILQLFSFFDQPRIVKIEL